MVGGSAALLRLQRLAGNRAVAAWANATAVPAAAAPQPVQQERRGASPVFIQRDVRRTEVNRAFRELRDAIGRGGPTADGRVAQALTALNPDERRALREDWQRSFREPIERSMRRTLSEDGQRRAIAILDGAPAGNTERFLECAPEFREPIRRYLPEVRAKVRAAVSDLEPGWRGLRDAVRTDLVMYFDPRGTNTINEEFVRLVRERFQRISRYMDGALVFDCNRERPTVCTIMDPHSQCGHGEGNGRLYWTCFDSIHVCATRRWLQTDDVHRARDLIHESAHNALTTTDRAYCDGEGWRNLTPWGNVVAGASRLVGGGVASVLGGGDSLNNPDSYSRFAYQRNP